MSKRRGALRFLSAWDVRETMGQVGRGWHGLQGIRARSAFAACRSCVCSLLSVCVLGLDRSTETLDMYLCVLDTGCMW